MSEDFEWLEGGKHADCYYAEHSCNPAADGSE